MIKKLSSDELAQQVEALENWASAKNREAIVKEYKFPSFSAAFAWMTQIAMLAEKMDHHPEWTNVYSRVNVMLATHEAGGVSERDILMAKKMDKLAKLYMKN